MYKQFRNFVYEEISISDVILFRFLHRLIT